MVLTFIGASLLWVGWFGFNAGSAVSAGMRCRHGHAGDAHAPPRWRRVTWMFVEWMVRGKPTVIGICSGAVAGLVADHARPPASSARSARSCIGVAAGIVCYWGCTGLKHMLGYDDALDAFGVHAVGGIVGALLTGVFAVEAYGGTAACSMATRSGAQPARRHPHRLRLRRHRVARSSSRSSTSSSGCASATRSNAKVSISRSTARPYTDRDTVRAETRHRPCRRGAPAQAGAPHFLRASRRRTDHRVLGRTPATFAPHRTMVNRALTSPHLW